MLVRSLVVSLALAGGMASTVLAQYPDGGSGPAGGGAGGMHRGRGMMGGRGGGMRAMDPVVLEGPPAPAEFAEITGVADTQRYARLYEHFMGSTRPQRDSLAAARGAMHGDFENGDREAGRDRMGTIKSFADDLSHQQDTFDAAVKDAVTKDEWKKYQDWRADRRKEAESRHSDMMGRRRGGGAPPEDSSDGQ
jgi:hypothetical protein